MTILEDLKNIHPPVELYHYTSQYGFLGILNTDSLWASKVHYLNDSTEFALALDLAKIVLEKRLAKVQNLRNREKVECLQENISGKQDILEADTDQVSRFLLYDGLWHTSGRYAFLSACPYASAKSQCGYLPRSYGRIAFLE